MNTVLKTDITTGIIGEREFMMHLNFFHKALIEEVQIDKCLKIDRRLPDNQFSFQENSIIFFFQIISGKEL